MADVSHIQAIMNVHIDSRDRLVWIRDALPDVNVEARQAIERSIALEQAAIDRLQDVLDEQ